MHSDNLTLTGRLCVYLNNEVVREIPNLVVTAGKEFVAARMQSNSTAVMSHMAIGTGTTAAVVANTAAETEVARIALISSSVAGAVVTYTTQFPAGTPASNSAITEAALLNAASGGSMLCRTVFPVVNKSASDALTIVWTVQAS
jgi:hypothetical protein